MHRFYCEEFEPPADEAGRASDGGGKLLDSAVELDGDQSRHALGVLRLTPGQVVEVFNGRGAVGRGVLTAGSGGPRQAAVRVESFTVAPRPRPELLIAAAIPKGPRAEDMLNQLSQLGVDRFVPLLTARSVVDPRPGKVERFGKAAVESAKQSGRAYVMTVEAPAALARVLTREADVRLLAAPGARQPGDLPARLGRARSVIVLIGPEGGWTDDETAQAAAGGYESWAIGPHILRIEAAAAAAAGVIRYLAGT